MPKVTNHAIHVRIVIILFMLITGALFIKQYFWNKEMYERMLNQTENQLRLYVANEFDEIHRWNDFSETNCKTKISYLASLRDEVTDIIGARLVKEPRTYDIKHKDRLLGLIEQIEDVKYIYFANCNFDEEFLKQNQ